jgi:dTMP kinase
VALQALISVLYSENPRFALFGLGWIMMARLLPSLIMGPVAGVLADRYDRKRLMVVTDLVRGALFILVAFSESLTTLFLLTFAVECFSLLFLAAKDSTLPVIVRRRHLTQANQLNLLLAYGTLPAGALLATAITTALLAGGFAPREATVGVLLFNAGSFFVGAALLSRLQLPEHGRRSTGSGETPGLIEELREGVRFIRDLPLIRSLIVGVVGVFFGAGVVVTLGPEFVRSSLGQPPTDWPRLMTAVGLGLVVGIVTVPLATRRVRQERLFPITMALAGAMAMIIATVPSFIWALTLGTLLGAAAGLSFVMGYTLLQQHTPDPMRGKTFGAFYTVTRTSLFAALGIAPFIAGAISGSMVINGQFLRLSGVRITIFLGGLVALYSSLSAMRGIGRALRSTESGQLTIPSPSVDLAGLFIAFEGVEGSGKSTQVRRLVATLQEEGLDVVVTREPGGPPVAERIRDVLLDPNSGDMDPRTEALLYAAARAEHVRRVVAPALEQGKVVVCDRFIDSSLAYQGFARELGDSDVLEINRWAVEGVLPDIVVLLDVDVDEGLRRVRERTTKRAAESSRADQPRPLRLKDAWRDQAATDRLEAESPEFHHRVAAGYRELARRDRGRFVIVDGTADADTVARQIRVALHPWLTLPNRVPPPADAEPEAGSA